MVKVLFTGPEAGYKSYEVLNLLGIENKNIRKTVQNFRDKIKGVQEGDELALFPEAISDSLDGLQYELFPEYSEKGRIISRDLSKESAEKLGKISLPDFYSVVREILLNPEITSEKIDELLEDKKIEAYHIQTAA